MGRLAGVLPSAGAALTGPPTAPEVRRLLAAYGLAPHKRRGQNFVVDPNTVRAMVRRADVGSGDVVAEIGPGLGALTLALVEAGARVVAVEVDAGLVRALAEVLADTPEVQVVHADAAAVDWKALVGAHPAKLVANLPYHVATGLVLHALESEAFERLEVMVQREVGERWAARQGDERYSGTSVKVAAYASAVVDGRVSRHAFLPEPAVDSVTVRLEPRPWQAAVPRSEVVRLVDVGFRQRRKRLRNALATDACPPGHVETALQRAGLDPGSRAEELDLAAWTRLAGALTSAGR